MLHSNVMAAEKPETVAIEHLPGGTRRVVLSRNFVAHQDEDGTSWRGEQAVFVLEPDRAETAEDIAAGFDGWWDYAAAYSQDNTAPTVEQRLESVENVLLAMMGL